MKPSQLLPVILFVLAVTCRDDGSPAADPDAPMRDLHGDALPKDAAARYGTTRARPSRGVVDGDLSADGTLLATVDGMARAAVWDARTGKRLWVWDSEIRADDCVFSPDGRQLAVAADSSKNGGVWLLDARTGKQQQRFTHPYFGRVAYSPDGCRLAMWKRSLTVEDLQTGRNLMPAPWDWGMVSSATFSTDGRKLAVGLLKGQVQLWDLDASTLEKTLNCESSVPALTFSPDGKWLVAVRNPINEFAPKLTREPKPTDSYVVTKVFQVTTGEVVSELPNVVALRFLPDSKTLMARSYEKAGVEPKLLRVSVTTWKVTETSLAASPEVNVISRDGKWLATMGQAGMQVRSLPDGKPMLAFAGPQDQVGELAVSRDGRFLASAHGMDPTWKQRSSPVHVWDVNNSRLLKTLDPGGPGATRAAFSSDGSQLATAGMDGAVRIWSTANWRLINTSWMSGTLAKQPVMVTAAESPHCSIRTLGWLDDRQVLAATDIKWLQLVDTTHENAKGRNVERFGWQIQCARQATFAVVLDRGRGVLIEPLEGKTLRQLESVSREIPRLTVVSDNGRWIASASEKFDGTGFQTDVQVWDSETGKPVRDLKVPDMTTSMAISDDGRFLATGHPLLRGIRLWKISVGTEAAAFIGHEGNVVSLTFSADNRWLFSGSTDCTALRWAVP